MDTAVKNPIPSVLVLLFLLIPGELNAKEDKGAVLHIQKIDGGAVKGELITVKQNVLLLKNEYGSDESVDISDVSEIRVVAKSKALLCAGIGFAATGIGMFTTGPCAHSEASLG